MIDDYLVASVTTCSFPTSDLRSADRRRTSMPPIIPPRRNLTLPTANASEPLPGSKYSNVVPRRKLIAPGVWSDGCNVVLSAACPDVQTFLTCAREEMSLPVAPSEAVFALAALEVFYRIDDPVHWMFWSERRKDETAEVVNRISRTCNLLSILSTAHLLTSTVHRPPLIRSRVAWNGISEYLFILASLHGPTSSPLYETKDWYLILNPPKASSPPRVPNLRKRKPQQADLRETPGSVVDQEADEEEPPTKKPKTKRSLNSKKSRRSKDATDPMMNESHPEISPAMSSISLPPKDLVNVSIVTGSVELPTEEPPLSKRPAVQKPRHNAPPSVTPDSLEPAKTCGIPMPTFVSSPSHSRNRSTSQTSSETSSQTLVAERRSASVLSVVTIIEIPVAGKEGLLDSNGDEAADDALEPDGRPESESGMVTRGRANKARTTGGEVVRSNTAKVSTKSRPKGRVRRNAK